MNGSPTGGPQGISNLLYRRYADLLSGKLKPWELPEFQGLERTLSRAGARGREGLAHQLTGAGVRGPAMGMALEKAQESAMAPAGAAVSQAYRAIPGEAMGVQSHLDQLWQAAQNRILQAQLAKKARHSQEEQSRTAAVSNVLGGLLSCVLATACCGPDSIEVKTLRIWRDYIVPTRIIRGYYIFSDVLLPIMRFKLVQRFVKKLIVDSLIGAGAYWIDQIASYWKTPIDVAVATIFLKFWGILGSRGPYRRRNGEIF